jgi:hypothetical protein
MPGITPSEPVFTTTPAGAVPVLTDAEVGPLTDAMMVPDVMTSGDPDALDVSDANDPGVPRRSTPRTAAADAATTEILRLDVMGQDSVALSADGNQLGSPPAEPVTALPPESA